MGIDAEMFVRTRQNYTPQQVRRMAVDIAEAFGHDSFWIWDDYDRTENHAHLIPAEGTGRHALELVTVYTQDGDDIIPEEGEQFIRVYPGTRYYGPGYERGNIIALCGMASWLEARIPDAQVWYGGDSSGVCAEPFGPIQRAEMFAHFARDGHRPYTGGFGRFVNAARDVVCGFCDYAMHHCGGGGGLNTPTSYEFYRCGGCGKHAIRHADGRVVPVPRGKDFHEVTREAVA